MILDDFITTELTRIHLNDRLFGGGLRNFSLPRKKGEKEPFQVLQNEESFLIFSIS